MLPEMHHPCRPTQIKLQWRRLAEGTGARLVVVTLQYCSTLFYNSIPIPSPLHLHLSPHHLHLPTAFAALPTLSPSPLRRLFFANRSISLTHWKFREFTASSHGYDLLRLPSRPDLDSGNKAPATPAIPQHASACCSPTMACVPHALRHINQNSFTNKERGIAQKESRTYNVKTPPA